LFIFKIVKQIKFQNKIIDQKKCHLHQVLILVRLNNEKVLVNISFHFLSKKKRNSFCFKATRKEEVAGIRSKFANSKFFVFQYFLNNQNLHYFRNSRDCRTIS
jgi:hypothetical protein